MVLQKYVYIITYMHFNPQIRSGLNECPTDYEIYMAVLVGSCCVNGLF